MKRRRFRVRNLLLSWTAYWLALIVVGLSPAIIAIRRVAALGPGRGKINAGIGDTGLSATVFQDGVLTYSGSMSLLAAALLVAVPPLVMWAVFVIASSRTNDAGENGVVEQSDAPSLNAGNTEFFSPSSVTSKRTSREGS
ncbi:MAG TPA: hypothetical protein VJ840_12190 [Gemmatimonadaceae bacterium]|nr:hypothetical protein [Gemmatimonadaceae bacterium]